MRYTNQARAAVAGGAALAALFLAGSPAARAQTGILPVRLKLGILSAQDRDVRQAVGSILPMGEIEVALPGLAGGGQTSITLGYIEGRRSGGRHFRAIPLTIGRTLSPPNPASGLTGNVYFGYGAGLYYLRGSRGGDSDNETTFGGYGVAGYNLPRRLLIDFVEAKFHLVAGSANGLSPNGFTFLIGRRL